MCIRDSFAALFFEETAVAGFFFTTGADFLGALGIM